MFFPGLYWVENTNFRKCGSLVWWCFDSTYLDLNCSPLCTKVRFDYGFDFDSDIEVSGCALKNWYWFVWSFSRHFSFLLLKVSESQKHFFLNLHCPKNEWNKYSTNLCPRFIRLHYLMFCLFLGNGVSRKIEFEICWPLLLSENLKTWKYIYIVCM